MPWTLRLQHTSQTDQKGDAKPPENDLGPGATTARAGQAPLLQQEVEELSDLPMQSPNRLDHN